MKNKGFTLIEMLGSIIILAIIALIAFPSVLNLINNSQDKIDSSTEDLILGAAREYVESNVNSFPKSTTNTITTIKVNSAQNPILVSTLKSKGYLDSSTVKDTDTINNSVVCVYDEITEVKIHEGTAYEVTNIVHNYKYKLFDDSSKCV